MTPVEIGKQLNLVAGSVSAIEKGIYVRIL